MAQCIQCRKARKLKKGLCKACRRKEETMSSFRGLPESEMNNVFENLIIDIAPKKAVNLNNKKIYV